MDYECAHKYNVGDVVILLDGREVCSQAGRSIASGAIWVDSMDDLIGACGVITNVSFSRDISIARYKVHFETEEESWWADEDWIVPYVQCEDNPDLDEFLSEYQM